MKTSLFRSIKLVIHYHIIMTLLVILVGCASNPSMVSGDRDFPERKHWNIQSGTVIDITVRGEPTFSRKNLVVDGNGYIIYSPIGRIRATKFSDSSFKRYITKRLSRKYFRNPKVTISLKHNAKIYVLGEVNEPGLLELHNPVTILEAIKLAGSFSENSQRNKIRIVRQTPNGEKIKTIYLKKIGATWIKNENIIVMPDDLIMVN